MIKLDDKGQGAIEYLLLIGGAILVAALVLALMSMFGSGGKNVAETKVNNFYNIVGV